MTITSHHRCPAFSQPRRQEQLPHAAAAEAIIRAQQLDQHPGVRRGSLWNNHPGPKGLA